MRANTCLLLLRTQNFLALYSICINYKEISLSRTQSSFALTSPNTAWILPLRTRIYQTQGPKIALSTFRNTRAQPLCENEKVLSYRQRRKIAEILALQLDSGNFGRSNNSSLITRMRSRTSRARLPTWCWTTHHLLVLLYFLAKYRCMYTKEAVSIYALYFAEAFRSRPCSILSDFNKYTSFSPAKADCLKSCQVVTYLRSLKLLPLFQFIYTKVWKSKSICKEAKYRHTSFQQK